MCVKSSRLLSADRVTVSGMRGISTDGLQLAGMLRFAEAEEEEGSCVGNFEPAKPHLSSLVLAFHYIQSERLAL